MDKLLCPCRTDRDNIGTREKEGRPRTQLPTVCTWFHVLTGYAKSGYPGMAALKAMERKPKVRQYKLTDQA